MKRANLTAVYNQEYESNHFHIYPNTGERLVYGNFTDQKDFGTSFLNHMSNKQPDRSPALNYSNCNIVVDETTNNYGFRSMEQDHHLVCRITSFSACNAVLNISRALNNNTFWVWENWNGVVSVVPSSTLWANTMTKITMPTAFYNTQQAIVDQMTTLDSSVTFTFDKSTLYLTYTGTRPIVFPFSSTFDPKYYSDRPLVTTTNTINSIPSNVSVDIKLTDPSTVVFDSTVNGVAVPMQYFDPAFALDTLAYKLGFTCGTTNNLIQMYYGYPQIAGMPNSSDPAVTTPYLSNQIGAIGIVIYPGATSGPGDVYGALKSCRIRCPQVISPIDGNNILANVDVAGNVALTQFTVTDYPCMPIRDQNGETREIDLQCVDYYQRPYPWSIGPPNVTVGFDVKLNAKDRIDLNYKN